MTFSVCRREGSVAVQVAWAGATRDVPPLWLRERCMTQLHPVNRQRLYDSHRLPVDLTIVEASVDADSLHVAFSDGHRESFAIEMLEWSLALPLDLPDPTPWDASLTEPPRHDWGAVMADDGAFAAALDDFLRFGCVLVAGAPVEPGTVLGVGNRFGHVRVTNWGEMFDVQSKPNPNDLAYTAAPLGPHTDNPYRDPVPGIQLLHCLVNETSGGASTLVDAVAVTDRLRAEDPAGFELLATVEVLFDFRDVDDDIRRVGPLVERDHRGRVTGLAYSPRFDYLPLMEPDDHVVYQRARQRLAELLASPEFEMRFVMHPGDIEVFDNSRVLHGRTGFDPNEGPRHLQGCYIDGDAPRSRYRVLHKVGR